MPTPTGTVRLHRMLRASPERVYRAFLDPDAMVKWLPPHGFTGKVHHLDVRAGGSDRWQRAVCDGAAFPFQETCMVFTKAELIASLQNEVRILLHLAGKIDHATLGYRPTPKQRSTIELLRYLSMMGPALVQAAKAGAFDSAAWTAAEQTASARTFEEALAAIAAQPETYAALLADVTDDDLRADIDPFGAGKSSRGAFLVTQVLCGCAAYRTQLFLYLKACGREELSTWNLWVGIDEPAAP